MMQFGRRGFIAGSGLSALLAGLAIPNTLKARELQNPKAQINHIPVLLKTNKYAPPANVSINASYPDTVSALTITGEYNNGNWQFQIPIRKAGEKIKLTFLLDGNEYNKKSSSTITSNASIFYQFDCYDICLSVYDELTQSRNVLAERLFTRENLEQVFDVVIIGSGMGGGVLANRLADLGINVAVLEAGSMLFPTHIGNLPRMTKIGVFTKHIWDLWYRYATKDYNNAKGSKYDGAQGFNVGGRSLFWGAFIPKMRQYEFKLWPNKVKNYLLSVGYEQANILVKKSAYSDCNFQTRVQSHLSKQLSEMIIFDAPLAIDYAKSSCQPTLPTGVFSTADLVVEAILTGVESKVNYPKVFQRHPAIAIETEGQEVSGVKVIDLDCDELKTVRAKKYILAAGSQESAKLAINSDLEPRNLIGRGMSDHPVFYTHFGIPHHHPLFSENSSAKIVIQDPDATDGFRPFNILLELGADINHGRFVDPELLKQHQKAKNLMLCEIVFLLDMPLDNRNSLTMSKKQFYAKPIINMHPQYSLKKLQTEALSVQRRILKALDAQALPGKNLELNLAPQGGVAHEVGTLRMQSTDHGSSTESVVNTDLRFHNYNNLYSCDLSVFPSSPAANPSLTLIGLALRLADHLSKSNKIDQNQRSL